MLSVEYFHVKMFVVLLLVSFSIFWEALLRYLAQLVGTKAVISEMFKNTVI